MVAVISVVVGCTNDYGAFDFGVGPTGGSAGSASSRDSSTDQSTGAGGTEEDAAVEAAGDQSADVVADATGDASEAATEASASDAPIDAPADTPTDVPADAPSDGGDGAADATSDAGVDAAEGGADASADADAAATTDAPGGADVSAEADLPLADAPPETDVSVAPDATDAAEGDEAVSCGAGSKRCNGGCVNVTDPATGCAAASCAPCALPHASAVCDATGACAVLDCGAGFEDCDTVAANGCEAELSTDVANCGSCGRACAGANVLSKQCSGGLCVSTCGLGHANCSYELSGADDGCERLVDNVHCGSCVNDCTSQGNGFKCGAAVANQCGCTADVDCRVAGSGGTCVAPTGLCTCGTTACRGGEGCRHVAGSPPDVCSCNGGAACAAGETCCHGPAGCHDLQNDPSNCGACGRSCPIGFFCSAGQCQCSSDLECNAGVPGTCAAGQCVCGANTCAKGQRCQPGGTCG